MNNKIGRNELCLCGSNKKYKKCCMNNNPSSGFGEVVDLLWTKLRKTEGEVINKLLIPYLAKHLPNDLVQCALDDSCIEILPDMFDKELLFNRLLIPWILFNWMPEEDFEIEQFDSGKTISQNYITTYKTSLTNEVISFIEAMNHTYYSFYIIQEVVLEKYLIVKDILLGSEHTIKEKMATHSAKRGNIVFGRILTMDNQSIFVGMAPYIIPTAYYNTIFNYKKWLIEDNDNQPLDANTLRDYSLYELVEYFFEIITKCYSNPYPRLNNTDGDPIIFSKSYFKLFLSPLQVLNKLLPLTLSEDPDDFLCDAELNSSGDVNKVDFPWMKKGNKLHKSWDNTIMGHIVVEGNRLTLETNSEKRTEKGKQLLKKYLGNDIVFQQTLLQTPEQKLQSTPQSNNILEEEDKLMESPEVQEQLKQMVSAHWKNWFDEKIPALNNKTPRQSAKTRDGRELLEALFIQYENFDANKSNKYNPDINDLKKELGLL